MSAKPTCWVVTDGRPGMANQCLGLAEALGLEPIAKKVTFTDLFLCLQLADGREIRVPLEFYPRLKNARKKQRDHYEIFGMGTSIHWPDLDEDLTVEGIVAGRPSRF